jgi:putative redox protein
METKHISLRWTSALRFEGGEPDGPVIPIDADNETAPGPMLQLLLAVASCSASDVVLILEKMRVPFTALTVDGYGDRRDEAPRRYLSLRLVFTVTGPSLDESKVRRAVDLSIEKYCSVIHSLNPDIPIATELVLLPG